MDTTAIVIVCMNNLKNLIPCLDSIIKYTRVKYEIWVNAYMFTEENLEIVQKKYIDVHWVINNEIAGFAENNNMILRQINTEYVLVLNDDTEFKEPVLDNLLLDIKKHDVDIVAPKMIDRNANVLWCGTGKSSAIKHLTVTAGLGFLWPKDKKFENGQGVFQTYNLCGACFLIQRDLFEKLGWFDEYYFFCPEDIALSTLANKLGYKVWTDADITLYHYQGKSSSRVYPAVLPALRKGAVHYYGNGNKIKIFLIAFFEVIIGLSKTFLLLFTNNKINRLAQWNTVKAMFVNKTPKEIFISYYNKL